MQEKKKKLIKVYNILYSGGGSPIACCRRHRRPFEPCAHGTRLESLWRPCAAPDQPSRRPTARQGPLPVTVT